MKKEISVVERLNRHYSQLSAASRRVADFILQSPHQAALLTLDDIAEATGVSQATSNRLAKKIGFTGFHEFKRTLRQELQEVLAPVEEFTDTLRAQKLSPSSPWAQSLKEDVDRISSVQAVGGEPTFAKACRLLIQADRLFILGYGSSAFIAQYGGFCFSTLRPNCEALSDSSGFEGAARKLMDAGPGDAVLQIAFARISRPALDSAKLVHAQKVPIVLITDNEATELAHLATCCLLVPRKSGFVVTGGGAGAMAVVEALARGAASCTDEEALRLRGARLTSAVAAAVLPGPRKAGRSGAA